MTRRIGLIAISELASRLLDAEIAKIAPKMDSASQQILANSEVFKAMQVSPATHIKSNKGYVHRDVTGLYTRTGVFSHNKRRR